MESEYEFLSLLRQQRYSDVRESGRWCRSLNLRYAFLAIHEDSGGGAGRMGAVVTRRWKQSSTNAGEFPFRIIPIPNPNSYFYFSSVSNPPPSTLPTTSKLNDLERPSTSEDSRSLPVC